MMSHPMFYRMYFLTYNGVSDPDPDSGFDAAKFMKGDFIAVETQRGAWDFVDKQGKKMQKLYFVADPRPKKTYIDFSEKALNVYWQTCRSPAGVDPHWNFYVCPTN